MAALDVGSAPRSRGKRSGRRCSGLLLLAALLAASPARADSYDEALREGAAARDRARETGESSDWRRAVQEFERAIVARDTSEARFELAEAATELENVAVAYESYELALQAGLSGKAADVASAFIDAHSDQVARLELRGPVGSSVVVNGEPRGRLPLARPLVVPAGRVHLRVVSPEAAPWEKAVYFEAQAVMRLAPELSPALAPEPEWQEGEPSWVGAHPGAIALLSVAGVSLVAGGLLAYESSDRDSAASDARRQIASAWAAHVDLGLISPSSFPCGSSGVAGGAVLFGASVASAERQSIIDDYRNACDQLRRRSESAERYRTFALVGFGVSTVASAAVLAWYLADTSGDGQSEEEPAADAHVVPILTAETQGLLLRLRF